MHQRSPGLVLDVGGTHVRAAWVDGEGVLGSVHRGCSLDLESIVAVAREALGGERCSSGVVAAAGPVGRDSVALVNAGWTLEMKPLAAALGLTRLRLLNDLEALAHLLGGSVLDSVRWQDGSKVLEAPRAAVALGTGCGVALWWRGQALATEAGHVDLAATTAREWSLVQALSARFGRASAERCLSGPGLLWTYEELCALDGLKVKHLSPEAVAVSEDEHAVEARQQLGAFLGAFLADLALSTGARGGLVLAGGFLGALDSPSWRELLLRRMAQRGRYRPWVEQLPVHRLTAEEPVLLGAARALGAG